MHVKPSSQSRPLCHTSWHCPSIHWNWPVSRCVHYKRLCSDVAGYRMAVFRLVSKLRSQSLRHPALPSLLESIHSGRPPSSGNGKLRKAVKCSRIILPFHPCLSKCTSLLQELHKEFIEREWSDMVPVVTWCNAERSIARRILADTSSKLRSGRSRGG